MRTNYEYRAAARETLEGRWNETALMTLIIIAIPILLGVSTVCFPFMGLDEMSSIVMNSSVNGLTTLVSILVLVPLECAMYNVFVSMIRGTMENDTPVKEMFVFFKQDWVRYVKTYILEMIIIFLISLITLGIGGIILSYAYAMVPYLLHDYPELGAREALRMYAKAVPEDLRRAEHCTGCGRCNPHCPQSIDIPKELASIDAWIDTLKNAEAAR